MPPTAKNKILRHGFSHETIHKVYELPFQIKNDIKITLFQYKIIHNILATKVSLFRAKICDNNICPQCLIEVHSLDHNYALTLRLYHSLLEDFSKLVGQQS